MAMGILVVPDWKRFQNLDHRGKQISGAHPHKHGQKNPQGQKAVQKREFS